MVMERVRRILQRKAFTRAAKRYNCRMDGTMITVDRMTSYEGQLIDISIGGAMFRPRRAYLMDQRGKAVCLMLDEYEVFGHIASTMPMGYGIRFDEPLEDVVVETLAARHAEPRREEAAAA